MKKYDGNVAFKCTYHDRNYRGLCSTEGMDRNIQIRKSWCSDKDNPCFVARKEGKFSPKDNRPCSESGLFEYWRFGCGTYHKGKRRNRPIPANHIKAGKIAILTNRLPEEEESKRKIFGFLHIKSFSPADKKNREEAYVKADKKYSLEIEDDDLRPLFWDYYENSNNPGNISWGTGLFRYLTDEQVYLILLAIKERYKQIPGANKKKDAINFQIDRYSKIIDKKILVKMKRKIEKKVYTSEKDILNKLLKRHRNASPEKREGIFSTFERQAPSTSIALKSCHNFKCQLCGWEGFKTKSGGRYIEIHHLIPLSEQGTNEIDNLIVVCPNHHKMLDHSNTKIYERKKGEIEITIDEKAYLVKRNLLANLLTKFTLTH
jgi:hypothetical protein